MQVSSVMEKLRYFPQDAEVIASDYGLHVYLYGYTMREPEHNLEVVPSYDLNEVKVEELPWIQDPTWLDRNKSDYKPTGA